MAQLNWIGGETGGAKRKLSTSAVVKDQAKKIKVDDEQPLPEQKDQKPETATVVATPITPAKENGKEDRKAHDTASGTRIYYAWADGIHGLFDSDECPFLVPKSQLDGAYRRISAFRGTDEEKEDFIYQMRYKIDRIDIEPDEEGLETEEAKELEKVWSKVVKEGDWYFEMTLQKEKPENGKPSLEITLVDPRDDLEPEDEDAKNKTKKTTNSEDGEDSLVRWIVGFGVPDEESSKALEILKDYVWDGSD